MLGWDVAGALPDLRAQAESRMTETVLIGLWGDADEPDPVTGEAVRELKVERYRGKGRVRYPSYAVAESSPASQPVAQQDTVVSIPSGSGPVFDGDEVVVLASTSDSMVVGRRYVVKGQPPAGQTTAYRVSVVEQS